MKRIGLALLPVLALLAACESLPRSTASDDPRAGPMLGPGNPKTRGTGR